MKKPNYLHYALIFLVLLIAVQPLALARTTDRFGVFADYNKETKTITISNLIPFNDIVKLQLVENTYYCGVECSATMKVSSNFLLDTSVENYYLVEFDGKVNSYEQKLYYYREETYEVNYECENCEDNAEYDIPFGMTVKEYFKNEKSV